MSESELVKFDESEINDRIYSIRGYQVMLDRDLAELYGVETKRINEAVKRNKERFPVEFCFQPTISEYAELRSQIATSNEAKNFVVTQIATPKKGGRRYIPSLFTEQGVAMLSAVLKSETAVRISIQIIKAFVAMRKFISSNAILFNRMDNLEIELYKTNKKVDKVFNALESKEMVRVFEVR